MAKVNLTERSLDRVGVELLEKGSHILLRCKTCGCTWSPNIQPGGRLPGNWWKCGNDQSHTQLPVEPETFDVDGVTYNIFKKR